MKKSELQHLIREEIKKTLSEIDRDPLTALKSGNYDGIDEFVELWREKFKSTNTLKSKKWGFEKILDRPLTDEEYQALDNAGLIWKEDGKSTPSQEDHYDLVRDLKSALGKGNALRTVSNYLGRMLSKSEIRALISAGVINPRVVK